MKGWTAHLKPGRDPVLVPEGWSWRAFLFGPLWLVANQAWVPALLHAALLLLVTALVPAPARAVLLGTLAVLAGLLGRDLVRWSLDRRGYLLAHVISARDEETALGRLLAYRPDVAAAMAGELQ